MTNDTTDLHSQAQSILSSIFFRILLDDSNLDFETFEDRAISTLHKLATTAIGAALEKYDKVLCSNLPEGYRIHDRRERMLATEIGDLFSLASSKRSCWLFDSAWRCTRSCLKNTNISRCS